MSSTLDESRGGNVIIYLYVSVKVTQRILNNALPYLYDNIRFSVEKKNGRRFEN